MLQFRTLALCASSLLLLSIAVPVGKAHAQSAEAVSPWLWGTASIKVSECKDRADKFLEAKGLVVTKVTSQGSANTTNANAEAASQEFFVLVDCVAEELHFQVASWLWSWGGPPQQRSRNYVRTS